MKLEAGPLAHDQHRDLRPRDGQLLNGAANRTGHLDQGGSCEEGLWPGLGPIHDRTAHPVALIGEEEGLESLPIADDQHRRFRPGDDHLLDRPADRTRDVRQDWLCDEVGVVGWACRLVGPLTSALGSGDGCIDPDDRVLGRSRG